MSFRQQVEEDTNSQEDKNDMEVRVGTNLELLPRLKNYHVSDCTKQAETDIKFMM